MWRVICSHVCSVYLCYIHCTIFTTRTQTHKITQTHTPRIMCVAYAAAGFGYCGLDRLVEHSPTRSPRAFPCSLGFGSKRIGDRGSLSKHFMLAGICFVSLRLTRVRTHKFSHTRRGRGDEEKKNNNRKTYALAAAAAAAGAAACVQFRAEQPSRELCFFPTTTAPHGFPQRTRGCGGDGDCCWLRCGWNGTATESWERFSRRIVLRRVVSLRVVVVGGGGELIRPSCARASVDRWGVARDRTRGG